MGLYDAIYWITNSLETILSSAVSTAILVAVAYAVVPDVLNRYVALGVVTITASRCSHTVVCPQCSCEASLMLATLAVLSMSYFGTYSLLSTLIAYSQQAVLACVGVAVVLAFELWIIITAAGAVLLTGPTWWTIWTVLAPGFPIFMTIANIYAMASPSDVQQPVSVATWDMRGVPGSVPVTTSLVIAVLVSCVHVLLAAYFDAALATPLRRARWLPCLSGTRSTTTTSSSSTTTTAATLLYETDPDLRAEAERAGDQSNSDIALRLQNVSLTYRANRLYHYIADKWPTLRRWMQPHQYTDRAALDGVTLCAERGSILCLLGQNGAGKTTAVRVITGSSIASAGAVTVDSSSLGVCTQFDVLWPSFTVCQSVSQSVSQSTSPLLLCQSSRDPLNHCTRLWSTFAF
jgi:ABC-type multidrug transport system fused ATPase/permease subunit